MNSKIRNMLTHFWRDTSGLAASEVALLLPLMMTLLLGITDVGRMMITDTKTNTAAQVVADLLTRHATAREADVTDAYAAARMAIQPYSTTNFGLDVASIQFQGTNNNPVVIWRRTFNMTANAGAAALATGLGVQGEGVLVVTTNYSFAPVFLHGVIGDKTLREVAIAKPRRGSYIAIQ